MNIKNIFGGAVYINLDDRVDRNNGILEELGKIGIEGVERFSAVRLTDEENENITRNGGLLHPPEQDFLNRIVKSERSCALSHLGVIKLAKENNWESVLILEDDCIFLDSFHEGIQEVKNFMDTNDEWGFIYIGLNLRSEPLRYNDKFFKLRHNFSTTHSYIVHKRMYDKILNFSLNDFYAIDLLYSKLSIDNLFVCYKQLLTTQRDGHSNIENREMSYSYYFSNNFKKNTLYLNNTIDLSKIGFFYQTARNPCAVEMNLTQLKKFYPTSPIVVWEDITDLCSDICHRHHVPYFKVKRLPSDITWHNSQPITEITGGLHYLHRLYISCMTTLKDADWIMHYEDDVWCSGHINKLPNNEWGGTIRTGWEEELNQYVRDEMKIEGSLFHGACGGALISRDAIIKSYLKLQEIDWVEILKRDKRIAMYSDYLISFMLINGGYKWSWWDNWEQGGYHDFMIYKQPFIHNIKYWYFHDLKELKNINSADNVKFFIEKNNNFNLC